MTVYTCVRCQTVAFAKKQTHQTPQCTQCTSVMVPVIKLLSES